jgi:hypothetical protein
MLATYIDPIVMFLGGAFATWVGRNWASLKLGDQIPAARRDSLARLLKVLGPGLMVIAVLFGIMTAMSQP